MEWLFRNVAAGNGHLVRCRLWNSVLLLGVLVLMLPVVLGNTPAQAVTQVRPNLRVESNTAGEIGLEARGATLEDALNAIAVKTGVEVRIEPGVPRPPVNITIPMAPVEDVLRELLHGRNYALVYDGEDAPLSQVIVLRPSVAGPPSTTYRPPYRR